MYGKLINIYRIVHNGMTSFKLQTKRSCTLHFGLNYELIYQFDAIEYLFVYFQLDIFRAYTPIFRSNGC